MNLQFTHTTDDNIDIGSDILQYFVADTGKCMLLVVGLE